MSGTLYDTHKTQLDIFLWALVVMGPRVELGQKEMTPCAMHEEMMQKKPIAFGLDVNMHTGSCHGSQGYDGKKLVKELQTREEKALQQRRPHW